MTPIRRIKKLTELLDLLDSSSKDQIRSLPNRISIPLVEFESYSFFSQEHYTRNCIKRTDDYELILLCWEEGQKTPIHCHNEQECWVHVVKGEFIEKRYKELNDSLALDHEVVVGSERLSYMNDEMGYHSLENSFKGRSYSLHLYMEPIDECRVYDSDRGTFTSKSLEDHSFQGKLQTLA